MYFIFSLQATVCQILSQRTDSGDFNFIWLWRLKDFVTILLQKWYRWISKNLLSKWIKFFLVLFLGHILNSNSSSPPSPHKRETLINKYLKLWIYALHSDEFSGRTRFNNVICVSQYHKFSFLKTWCDFFSQNVSFYKLFSYIHITKNP